MPISYWRRLSTPLRQLIVLLTLLLVLLIFLASLSVMVTLRIQRCLDDGLYAHASALRSWFVDEGYYLRDEARLLAEIDAFEDMLSSHNEVQLRRLMALYQNTHHVDGVYLITDSGQVFTSPTSPILDDAIVRGLDLVQMGFNGQALTEMVTVDGEIWLMSVAPHIKPDGAIDAVFLITRSVDSAFMESLSRGLNGALVLSDGEVLVKSHAGEMQATISIALKQAVDNPAEEAPQPFTTRIDDTTYRVLVTPLVTTHSGAYALALVKNAEIISETLWQTLRWGALFGIIVIALILILVQFHIVGIFRPLDLLVQSTQRIAAGDLDEPLEPSGVAEVYDLALSFEAMRARLKELLERERSLSEKLEAQVQEKSQTLEEACRVREQLIAQLISSQEEERRRVSRELHDTTSQELASFIVHLGTLSRTVEDEGVLQQLNVLRTQAVKTLEGVNRIVLDLRPGLLDEYGLVPAVQWYADTRLGPLGISIKMEVRGEPHEIPPSAQANIYRMMQEAINNAAEHAQASKVIIRIRWGDEQLQVEIEDNGRGFDLDKAFDSASDHYGLLGMRERSSLLDGTLDIRSSPGSGTLITARIPYTLNSVRKNGQD